MEKLIKTNTGIKSKNRYLFITSFGILLFIMGITPKVVSQCVPPDYNAMFCENAPLLCLNQYCSTTSDFSISCCNGWCGNNTVISNPQYFQFIPTSPDVVFEIHVDDCDSGNGLQCAILDACPWDNGNVLDCNPGTPPGGTMILQPSGLNPFQPLWLVIDGNNGDICNFTISYTSGILDDFEISELDPELTFASDTVVCPGFGWLQLQTGSLLLDTYAYLWVAGWNGDTLTSTDPVIEIQIPSDVDEGFWNICVRGYSGCDTTNEICIPIEIRSLEDRIKDTATFCQNEFPFDWRDQHIVGPGTYHSMAYEGQCSFDSIWTVLAHPLPSEGIIDTIACGPYFEYEGLHYYPSGTYLLLYPGQSYLGCDSIAHLNLQLQYAEVGVELHCQFDQMVLKAVILEQYESVDTITYEWYSCNFDSLLSTAPVLLPDSFGCFSLIVDAGSCLDTINADYASNPCLDTCYFYAGAGCVGTEMLLTYPYSHENGESIDWLISIPGMPDLHFENEDSIYINVPVVGSYSATVTIEDLDDAYICIGYFDVEEGPEVSLCCDQSVCNDSCATLTITNNGPSPADVFLSIGSGALFITGIIASHNFDVCPNDGDPLSYSIVQVTATSLGCQGTIYGDSTATVSLFPSPFVSLIHSPDTLCSSPSNLASYKWTYCDSIEVLSTEPCFAPPVSGCYCLEVENELGCAYKTCTDFFISSTSSIQENEIRISPNPTSGLIQIELFQSTLYPASWQLTDLKGINILEGELSEKTSELNFTSIPSGIYFLKIKSKTNDVLVRKIVIE